MQKHINLSDGAVEIVKKYKEKNQCKSFNDALELLIRDQERNSNIADEVSNRVTDNLNKILTRIRLGTNTADINSQVIIEILNSIVHQFDVKPMTTKFEETTTVRISREEVKEKIAYYKQLKDHKNTGKEN